MTAFLSADKILWLVVLVLPGFVAHKVYSLLSPSPRQESEKLLPDVIVYSTINLVFWNFWVIWIASRPIDSFSWFERTSFVLIVCLISPAGLAHGWHWLRVNKLHQWLKADHPTPRGWEYFVKKHGEFMVLFHLKGERKAGGYFGPSSYAATYPQDPEIYVEQVWRVDDDGVFIEPIEHSVGMVVRQAEWEGIEFFSVQRELTDERSAVVQQGAGGDAVDDPAHGGDGGSGPAGNARGPAGQDHPTAGRHGHHQALQQTPEVRSSDVPQER